MSSSFRSFVGQLGRPLRRLWAGQTGQGLVEYGLIIAVVSIGAIVSLTFLGDSITGLFDKTSGNLASSTSAPPAPVITSGPTQPETTDRDATFAYTTQFADFVECKLDTDPWAVCPDTTAQYLGPLPVGAHQFQVRATNDFGTSPPANWDWTVLGSPPLGGTPVVIGNRTYYYYPPGVVNGSFGQPDGLEGFYTIVNFPANAPPSFTVDGWTFTCTWHNGFFWSAPAQGSYPAQGFLLSACVNVPVPSGGSATLAPAGPVDLDTQLTASTSGWSGTPTSYEYVWQRNNNTDCTVGPYTNWDTNNSASASNSNTPDNLSEGNRCYRVVVAASNYGGDSASVTTNAVLVQNPPVPSGGSVTITEAPTVPLNTAIHATTTWTAGNPTSYQFVWQQGTAGAPCASASFSGTWDSDTNSTPNDTLGNTPNSLSEGNRCYRVTVTATGLGGPSQTPQPFATVFVQNPPPAPTDNQPVDASMTLVGGGTSAATIVGTAGQWYSQTISGNGNAPDISGGAVMRDSGGSNPANGSACGFTLANGFAFSGKTWHVASSTNNDWDQPGSFSNDYEYACY